MMTFTIVVIMSALASVAALEPINIVNAVALWKREDRRGLCIKLYGNISFWDTGSVTNMNNLFYQSTEFNEDLSKWDVSKVTDMLYVSMRARLFSAHRST